MLVRVRGGIFHQKGKFLKFNPFHMQKIRYLQINCLTFVPFVYLVSFSLAFFSFFPGFGRQKQVHLMKNKANPTFLKSNIIFISFCNFNETWPRPSVRQPAVTIMCLYQSCNEDSLKILEGLCKQYMDFRGTQVCGVWIFIIIQLLKKRKSHIYCLCAQLFIYL